MAPVTTHSILTMAIHANCTGAECAEYFRDMHDCMSKHEEYYGAEYATPAEDDDEAEPASSGEDEAPPSDDSGVVTIATEAAEEAAAAAATTTKTDEAATL